VVYTSSPLPLCTVVHTVREWCGTHTLVVTSTPPGEEARGGEAFPHSVLLYSVPLPAGPSGCCRTWAPRPGGLQPLAVVALLRAPVRCLPACSCATRVGPGGCLRPAQTPCVGFVPPGGVLAFAAVVLLRADGVGCGEGMGKRGVML